MQIGAALPEMHNSSRELHDALVVVAKGKFIGGVMKVKLGELTKIKTGKLDANASSPDGEYPFFTCSKEPLKISSYSYDCECVLVAGNGDLNVKYYNGKFDAYQRTYIIEDNSNGRLYLPYLYYFMNGYVEELRKLSIGGVIKYIKLRNLTDALIELPDIETQKYIVSILSKIKELIGSRYQELKILENLIKARFVEMFGNGHDGFCNTKKLGEFCKFQQGTQIPVEEQIEEQLEGYTRFLRIIDYTQAPQIPRYVSVKGREIAEDSVVIVRYGATAGFVGHGYAGILANNLFEVVPDESILSKDFLYLALKYGTFEQEVHDKAFGAAMPALSFGMMNDIGVVTPNSTAQNGFVDFVKQVDKSKATVQKALDETQLLFDSLMQQYFG